VAQHLGKVFNPAQRAARQSHWRPLLDALTEFDQHGDLRTVLEAVESKPRLGRD